jgi:hypothetical protein
VPAENLIMTSHLTASIGCAQGAALLLAAIALGPSHASAQSNASAQLTQSPLRSAGVLHLASGTWTRSTPSSALGPDVLFNNDAHPAYFMSMPEQMAITNEGRLPSTDSEGTADAYAINAISIAYCSGQTSPLTATLQWYENYAPCTDPTANPSLVQTLVASGLPTTSTASVQSCWLLTIDLTGSTLEFELGADGNDGSFDNDPALDSFGWTVEFSGHGTDFLTGAIVAGDPATAAFGAGTKAVWGFGPGPGTGLGEQDGFWIQDTILPTACYDLGGYPATPWAGMYCQLFGGDVTGDLSTHYNCTTTSNSTGNPAHLMITGSDSLADNNFVITAAPVPNQPGIFFYGTTQINFPFGNGFRCAGGALQRLGITFASGNVLTREASAELIAFGSAGLTRNFQAWYRDPAGGGLSFNFSDAASITIQP